MRKKRVAVDDRQRAQEERFESMILDGISVFLRGVPSNKWYNLGKKYSGCED